MDNTFDRDTVFVWQNPFWHQNGYFFFVPERFMWNHVKQIFADKCDVVVVPADDWKLERSD